MKREWMVEWVESVPEDEFGDADLDSAKYGHRRFSSKAEAERFAKEAAGESYWGVAQIQPVEPVSRSQIEDDDWPYHWWIEDGRLMGYVGECEEVEA